MKVRSKSGEKNRASALGPVLFHSGDFPTPTLTFPVALALLLSQGGSSSPNQTSRVFHIFRLPRGLQRPLCTLTPDPVQFRIWPWRNGDGIWRGQRELAFIFTLSLFIYVCVHAIQSPHHYRSLPAAYWNRLYHSPTTQQAVGFCFVFLVSKLQRQICRLLIAHKINKMKGPVTLWLPPFTVWTGRSSIMTRYQQAQKKLRLRATLSVPALVPWHHCVAQVPSSLSTHLSPRKWLVKKITK